ncbi:MAG: mechanosensitive ion channel [Acetobacteraceae bacterium]|nr:mechanosensitive ion channel [Acetobacteraceae bacterium]MBV8522501.1 mechanosensitive ion channel [Acetobacteraceae bacterium]
MSRLFLIAILVVLAAWHPAWAQLGAPRTAPPTQSAPSQTAPAPPAAAPPAIAPAPKPPAPASAAPLTPEQLDQLVATLKDDQKRAQLIATLEALAKAAPPGEGGNATPKKELRIPLAPGSLGAQVLESTSGFLTQIEAEAVSTFGAVRSIPSFWSWLITMTTDPLARERLFDTAWRLAVVLVAGWAAQRGGAWALRRPSEALLAITPDHAGDNSLTEAEEETPSGAGGSRAVQLARRTRPSALAMLRRMPYALAGLVLNLIPVLVFAIAGHVAATAIADTRQTRLVLLAVVDAVILCQVLLCIARMMFSPSERNLRLLLVSDEGASYGMRWTQRIVVVSIFGYTAAQVGLLFGLSPAAYVGVLKAVSLIDHVFLCIIVIQKRQVVARWIRGRAEEEGIAAILRRRFAATWHWVAVFYIIALWLVWAVELPNGPVLLLHFFIITTFVGIGARVTLIVVLGSLDRSFRISPEAAQRFPGLEARARVYHRLLRTALSFLVLGSAIGFLLEFWGVDVFGWLADSPLGERVVSALITIAVSVLAALAVWELANAAVARRLARLSAEGHLARSARLRTLLPLVRTLLLVTIAIIVGLMVLSEIGVNIAPLLAGAGIVGVAIGFGSQKLVQDLITGLFLLLENAMQVGDWVTVSGLSGTVENLSMRTIRLRAPDGSVHIIPFSAVTSVTNTNRGFRNALISVDVAYREDTDRVSQVLKDIVSEMRKEPGFRDQILGQFELWGVDRVDATSVTIAGQIVCTDAGRDPVQREFNGRVKKRFQELGIEMALPTHNVVLQEASPAMPVRRHFAPEQQAAQ